jgi:3-oxoacyl-(acyl-carrier-protein) synthase
MKNQDAVWLTGVGTANPLGTSFAETADNLLAGRSGIVPVTDFDVSRHRSQIGGRIAAIPTPADWDEPSFAALEPIERLFLWCCTEALRQAGLWERRSELRLGVVLGYGAEWVLFWEADWRRGGRRIHHPGPDDEALVRRVQRRLGLRGPAITVAAACASGNCALAVGRRWLSMGLCDVCLAGAGEMGVTPMSLACFGNLGALSRRNDAPAAASRPFDKGRDGIVLSEGGAMFVLEPAPAAQRRGARPLAELAGYGATSDASHMVIPSRDPEPAAAAVRAALRDAAAGSDEVDYLNAHATSTPVGDTSETRVLQAVLGAAVHSVPVSATKSMTGHALSGAAALDALACLTALERQAVPPTINLDDPDPDCALCHVAHQPRSHRVRLTVSNSFGFGGSNTCLVLRKVA